MWICKVCVCALFHGLAFCHRIQSGSMLSVENDEVELNYFAGRLGNNLVQLAHAIIYAESIGARRLVLPGLKDPSFAKLFDLPSSLSIRPNTKVRGTVKCRFRGVYDIEPMYGMECAGVQRSDVKRALIAYVKPYLRPDARASCAQEGKGFDGLTIHLRGGDLFNSTHPQARFPPCSLYTKVLQENHFAALRVVAEPGKQSPCINLFLRDSAVPVQIKNDSVVEAACALMSAQHLVYSLSTFADTLALLNTNLRSAAVPMFTYRPSEDVAFGGEVDPLGSFGHCSAPDKQSSETSRQESASEFEAEYALYEIPGLAQARVGSEKTSFLENTRSSDISKVKTCKL
eukprot:TRINITY_DN30571_c0_g1_i1.p1 TRINITY_DN30571_c0_g1~~TRINITY_DN30571_c0_g1_i1.p1  ORF type:complete len:344 (+),score=42.92 TRINITY_DN30571_c0_g1_i1:55-1086(+)